MAEKELSKLNMIVGCIEWDEIEKISYESMDSKDAQLICLKRIEITLDAILSHVETFVKEKKSDANI